MIGNYLDSPRHNKNVWQALAERLPSVGWEVITTSSLESQYLRLFDMLLTILNQRNNYDLAQIDVFSGKAFIFAELCTKVLRFLNKKIVLTLHGGGLPAFALKHHRRFQSLLATASAVVTPSPFHRESFKTIRPDIHIIPNPVDLTIAIYRQRYSAKPNLIWIRAFHSIYNPSLAIRVISDLKDNYPEVKLMMIGPDKGDHSLNNLMELARELGVTNNIEIVGPIVHSEVPCWLDKADIFINTSNFDTAPSSLMEAMANGLCVVSTNVGGVPYIIEDGKDGLLVPPGEPTLMADAIRKILTNHNLAERLSANARLKAIQYDWSSVLPRWLVLLQEVTDKNNG